MINGKLFGTIFSVGVATILTKLVALIALGYPARTLGPENYGIYAFGISIAAYSSIFIIPGLTVWGTRHIAQNMKNAGETLISINLVRSLLAIFCYLFIYAFTEANTSSLIEKYTILVCCLTIFTNALSAEWVLNGLNRTYLPPWLNLINTALAVSFLFALVQKPDDIITYAYISPAVTLLIIFLSYYFIYKSGVRFSFPSLDIVLQAISHSRILIAVFSLITIGHYAGNIIIKENLGLASLGIFMAAYYLFELTSSIPSLIGTIIFPKISKYVALDKVKASQLSKSLSLGFIVLGFFVVGVLYAEAPFIINTIFGPQYNGAINIFKIMCIGLIFNFAVCGYTNVLMAFSEDKTMLFVTLTSNILAVTLGFIFIPIYGLIGAAIVVAIIDFAGWLVSLKKYKQIIGDISINKWTRPAVAAVLIIVLSSLDFISEINIFFRLVLYLIAFTSISLRDIVHVMRALKIN